MNGFFDWLSAAPQQGGTRSGAGAPAPNYGYNGLGLIGAALQDAGATVSGRPSGGAALSQFLNRGLMANQAQARAALAQAMQSGDPAAIQKARAAALASGADTSALDTRFANVGNGTMVAINPVSQAVTPAYQAGPPVPRGFMRTPDGQGVRPIPGGPADPALRARQAQARRGVVPANVPQQQDDASQIYSYDSQGNLQP
jgi:hypothetical protein